MALYRHSTISTSKPFERQINDSNIKLSPIIDIFWEQILLDCASNIKLSPLIPTDWKDNNINCFVNKNLKNWDICEKQGYFKPFVSTTTVIVYLWTEMHWGPHQR